MLDRLLPRVLVSLALVSCSAGGAYVDQGRQSSANRGQTNGTMFDMVSMTPEGDQWTVRVRGETFWGAYSLEDRTDDLGSVQLTESERKKVWKLIKAAGITKRRKGKIDEENGYVMLRLREPSDDGDDHKITTVYVSRATEVEAIVELGDYLRGLIKKYYKEKAVF